VNYTVNKPVWSEVPYTYTECVPNYVQKQGTRKVARQVEDTVMQTVSKCVGSWQEQPYTQCVCRNVPVQQVAQQVNACDNGGCNTGGCNTGCGNGGCNTGGGYGGGCNTGCAPCVTYQRVCEQVQCSRKVWVPQMIQEQVPVKVCRTVWEEQPYNYTVCEMNRVERQATRKVCQMVAEQLSREVPYVECVPEQRSNVQQVKTCRMVQEQLTREVPYTECVAERRTKVDHVRHCNYVDQVQDVQVNVCVPQQVTRKIQVRVCNMVAQEIEVQQCATGCNYGGNYGGGCGYGGGCNACGH